MSVDQARVRDDILSSVMRFHGVTMVQLLSAGRAPEVVAARADAAQRLKISGFHAARIARILKRDPSVISDYLNGKYRGGKKDNRLTSVSLGKLPDDVREVVTEVARLSDTTPGLIIAEWVCERAQYEIEAKRRDVCGDTPLVLKRANAASDMEAA